jgi:hypothetical protein
LKQTILKPGLYCPPQTNKNQQIQEWPQDQWYDAKLETEYQQNLKFNLIDFGYTRTSTKYHIDSISRFHSIIADYDYRSIKIAATRKIKYLMPTSALAKVISYVVEKGGTKLDYPVSFRTQTWPYLGEAVGALVQAAAFNAYASSSSHLEPCIKLALKMVVSGAVWSEDYASIPWLQIVGYQDAGGVFHEKPPADNTTYPDPATFPDPNFDRWFPYHLDTRGNSNVSQLDIYLNWVRPKDIADAYHPQSAMALGIRTAILASVQADLVLCIPENLAANDPAVCEWILAQLAWPPKRFYPCVRFNAALDQLTLLTSWENAPAAIATYNQKNRSCG